MRDAEHEADGLTPAEREVEAALGALRPARAAIDRDRLLFDAGAALGRRRARRGVLVWRSVAAVVAAALGVALLVRSGETPVPKVVYVDRTPARQSAVIDDEDAGETPAPQFASAPTTVAAIDQLLPYRDDYLALRGTVTYRGADAVSSGRTGTPAVSVPTARGVRMPPVVPG